MWNCRDYEKRDGYFRETFIDERQAINKFRMNISKLNKIPEISKFLYKISPRQGTPQGFYP